MSNRAIEDASSLFPIKSLADDYLIDCHKSSKSVTFSLTKLSEFTVDEAFSHSEGAKAWACLQGQVKVNQATVDPYLMISADFGQDPAIITVSDTISKESEKATIFVLVRVLAQWGLKQYPGHGKIHLPDGTIYTSDKASDDDIAALFDCQGEIVEMVDRFGGVLAKVPRPLVHRHNLLHRGIGMFVTTKHATSEDSIKSSMWYVHRRTATKRIFPSLFDMFVGGVSLAGEENQVTALREVKEELGLERGSLSDPILTCVVCTAYNRCFVTLFAYLMNMTDDTVDWQEEEVAWGEFCSYAVIQAAADRSIQRLVEIKEWPGRLPAIQSTLKGDLDTAESQETMDAVEWKDWDFVPDGLLVVRNTVAEKMKNDNAYTHCFMFHCQWEAWLLKQRHNA